jgi:ubiquinone/menaquinone biosynthesis C-methylase UbiE
MNAGRDVPDLDYLRFDADFESPRVLAAYDELPLWSAMFGLLLLDEVPLRGVKRVLDVGCGTGFPLIELAERLGPEAQAHGLDLWKGAIARAAEKIGCRNTPNVSLHVGSAAQMPFPDATFDLIVSNLGLNNFDDAVRAAAECRRVARPRGTLALTTNLQGHMREFYDAFHDVLAAAGDADGLQRLDRHVRHRATVAGVRQLLEGAGWSSTRVIERTGRMRFASGRALLNHHFIKLGFLDAWKQVVPGREPEVFLRLQHRLDQMAAVAGELTLTIPMAYVEAVAA